MKLNQLLNAAAVLVTLSMSAAAAQATDDDVRQLTSKSSFADVVSNVEDAIINRGYVLDYRGRLGDMLKRTERDVGGTKDIYKNAEFLQFCSAVLSRKAMEADPKNIAYCPYVIFVYETENDKGAVNLGYRKLPAGEHRDAINTLLEQIATEAAGK